ncbi:MAG TPA: Gfo/Idh/MocA family oxidoreductase [Actinophytocola sp.]|uniref:Gfo/Idh/MocA family protein n=1 Tax=Actinophytocola sp. TaxID=1872138 RepID=UPI002DDCE9B1|nr:Gfo/Idh/MocA family oxidoreductase [Actinophytocola sp.]HEV2779443.1 Gfo/Idh/MocA family oxidoreductase [Actinophytocola sp.]
MTDSTKPVLGVGMAGYAFMGRAHSQAWRTVGHFFDLPMRVDLAAICGRDPDAVAAAARTLGWRSHETDWRRLIERDDIHLVDVCTPGSSHCEIAIAALEAGKHVLCEKPLANTADEAVAMVDAARRAARDGVRAMVGFNYRRVPAATLARRLVADGRIGAIRHVRAVYLQDWIVDPEFPLVWRLRQEAAGSGALGDLGAHIIDLSQYITGQRISAVSALTETFVRERPLPEHTANGDRGPVTVDDAALFLARLDGGAVATYEASRFATGRKNALRIEVNGALGSLAFDLERLNELEFYDGTDPAAEQGFTRILVTEADHPYLSAWWPPGHLLGYEHSFTHEVRDLVHDIAAGTDPVPGFEDGLQVQLVLDAVERSARQSAGWVDVAGSDRSAAVSTPSTG